MNISDSGPWSLGTLIGLPVSILLVVATLGIAVALIGWGYDFDLRVMGAFVLILGIAGAAMIASPWGMYPYKGEYHQWREVSGTVDQIDKRLISSGGKMEDKFVIRFEGSDLQFGCDDTRCAQVKPDDDLTLSCKRAWQYTGTDGYDCRFTSTTRPAKG